MYKIGVIFMGLMRHHLGFCVYIPINVISLYTVDFTEFDPMLPITTLWFSDYHPSLKTDNVVNNVFSIHILTSFISHRTKYVPSTFSVSKWNLQILLLSINASFWCILNDLQLITSLRGYSTYLKNNKDGCF